MLDYKKCIILLLAYTAEIYPTINLSSAIGICMSFGKLGNTLMPIIVNLILS